MRSLVVAGLHSLPRARRLDSTATQRHEHPLEPLLGPLGAEGLRVYHSRVWNGVVQLGRVFCLVQLRGNGVKRWSIPIPAAFAATCTISDRY